MPSSKLEVWIDNSSSLNLVDATDKSGGCGRKSLAVSLKSKCNDKIDLYSFNTSKKYMMHTNDFCINHGLNDTKKLINWIENSDAKRVIIITDIMEYTAELSDYVVNNGGSFRGAEVGAPIMSNELATLAGDIAKYCSVR